MIPFSIWPLHLLRVELKHFKERCQAKTVARYYRECSRLKPEAPGSFISINIRLSLSRLKLSVLLLTTVRLYFWRSKLPPVRYAGRALALRLKTIAFSHAARY